jgi:sigma-B regulation protein RsbU (phosphoserine phosphatase)
MTAPPAPAAVSLEMPPDGTSPGVARRHVRAALHDAGLDGLVDDALLLVTELVTNAVVHAGTAVHLTITTHGAGLHVEVSDQSPGATPVLRGEADSGRESGRGLFLLDALAESWGTTHTRGAKSVWFRLGADHLAATAPTPVPVTDIPVDDDAAPAVGWLLALPEVLEQQLSPQQLLTELLHRLADVLAVPTAALLVESEDDADAWAAAAVRGTAPAASVIAELRRRVLSGTAPVESEPGRTVITLRGRGGPFGALVVGDGPLDPAAAAVAQLAAERFGMVLRDERAEVAQQRQRGSLALLAEASDLFAATLDVQLAVTLATQLVVPRLAQWAAVYTVPEGGVRLSAVAHEDEEATAALRVALSSSAGMAFAERLSRDLAVHRPALVGRAELATVLADRAQGDVLALPLVARRRLLGGLVVARRAGGRYSAEDVSLLLDLARRAALAVDNARLYEDRTEIARALQESLLPPALPRASGVEFGARYHPAGEGAEVGGDFYDVFDLPDGGWAVAIGDVCGKGAEAAAITGLARNVVRLLVREGWAPSDVLGRLNGAVLELGERGRFCTAALAVIRPVRDGSGNLELTLCSGGHPPPVLVAAGNAPAFVGRTGTVLGVVDDPDLSDERLVLSPGDVLVLYTDGVTERRNGRQMFGDEMLLRVLERAAVRSADSVAGLVEGEVRRFAPGASRDDLAVLVVRASAPAAARPAVAAESSPERV